MQRPRHFLLALAVALAAVPERGAAQVSACEYGQVAIGRGLFSTALSYLTRCLEIGGLSDRNLAAVLHMRALAYSKTAEPRKASEDYRRSLDLKPPEIAWDLIPLGIYLREAGQHGESLEVLQRALALDEDGPCSGPWMGVFFHLGWTLHALRRYEEAINTYTQGMQKQSNFEGIYLRRALAHEAVGERAKARMDLIRVIEIGKAKGLDPATAPADYKSKFVEYELLPKE